VTTLPLGQYFGDPATHAYALRNASLRTDYVLPGVFVHNPYRWLVNGSLWTLPVEVRAYAALAAIGVVVGILLRRQPGIGRLNGQRRFGILAFVLLVAVGLVAISLKLAGVHGAAYGLKLPSRAELTGGFVQQEALVLVFGAGALLYLGRNRVPLRWGVLVALIAVWLIASHWKLGPGQLRSRAMPALVFPYLTVMVAFRGSHLLRRLTAWGDMSYGVYLWAFPIGQIVALVWGRASTPLIIIAVSLPLTCLVAAASWFTVERHALRLKPRGSHPVPPAGDPGHLDAAVRTAAA
jgi:peptidoglycan/LPS O-acetylase OafA/YrhL